MYRLFKGMKILAILIWLGGISSFAFIFLTNGWTDQLWYFIAFLFLMFFWFLTTVALTEIIATVKLWKINDLRSNKLLFQEFISSYQTLLAGNEKHTKGPKLKSQLKMYILCNLSAGYYDMGNDEDAYRTLMLIDYFPDNRSGAMLKFVYYNNLFVYYHRKNNNEEMAQNIEQMKIALENKKLYKKNRIYYEDICHTKQMLLNMKNGDYRDCEEYFEALVKKDNSLLEKLVDNYNLGEIYRHNKKSEKAKEVLNFILANGKDSYYASEAKKLLSQLDW